MRFVFALLPILLGLGAAIPTHAAPAEEPSRYERNVLQAQKRLIKHRHAKAKPLARRLRAKAKRLYKQQHQAS
jgi:hypothetical protein